MSGLINTYQSNKGKETLLKIINASPLSVSESDRKTLIQNLLDDIKANKIAKQDVPTALLAVKTLARLPEGSSVLIEKANLQLLQSLGTQSQPPAVASEALRCVANALLLIDRGRDAWLDSKHDGISGGQLNLQYLQDSQTNEEFCFLNARILFLTTLKQCPFVKEVSEDPAIIRSIAERYDSLLEAYIAGKQFAKDALTDVLKFSFNLLLQYPRIVESEIEGEIASPAAASSTKKKNKEKGKGKDMVMGEGWSNRFEPLIQPIINIFIRLPASKPALVAPLTHVIHVLLNIPVAPYTSQFFFTDLKDVSNRSGSSSSRSSLDKEGHKTLKSKKRLSRSITPPEEAEGSANGSSTPNGTKTSSISALSDPFQRAFSLLSSPRRSFNSTRPDPPKKSGSTGSAGSASASPTTGSPSRKSINLPVTPTNATNGKDGKRDRSVSPTTSTPPSSYKEPSSASKKEKGPASKDTKASKDSKNKPKSLMVSHACALFESTLETYWPGTTEADAQSVRDKARIEGINLDEALTPLALLLTRLADDTTARAQMREWVLPSDMDRSANTGALEARGDTLGRCIRLLSCVYFTRLKDAVGEWMYALCDHDGSVLSAQIGYGNAAGYLFNKGILSAPPPPNPSSTDATSSSTSTSTSSSGAAGAAANLPENINPITGVTNREAEEDEVEMTEEEKDREMEKLFVLFDRLEKTGMVAENPVRKAIQEGKISLGPFGP